MSMNKKLIAIASTALVLTAAVSIAPSMAYFTATATTAGKAAIKIEDTHTTVEEKHKDDSAQTKVISLTNEKAVPCFTRVLVVMPNGVEATYSGEGWELGTDGYYYYDSVVEANGKAADLTIDFTVDDAKMAKENPDKLDSEYRDFNIIVIPESSKVLYAADGSAVADWTQNAIYEEGQN